MSKQLTFLVVRFILDHVVYTKSKQLEEESGKEQLLIFPLDKSILTNTKLFSFHFYCPGKNKLLSLTRKELVV